MLFIYILKKKLINSLRNRLNYNGRNYMMRDGQQKLKHAHLFYTIFKYYKFSERELYAHKNLYQNDLFNSTNVKVI